MAFDNKNNREGLEGSIEALEVAQREEVMLSEAVRSNVDTTLSDVAPEPTSLDRFKSQYDRLNFKSKGLFSWEDIKFVLNENEGHYLKLAESMHEGGVFFGVDEAGNLLFSDAGPEPIMTGMTYGAARNAVMFKPGNGSERPRTGYELFPANGLRKSKEIIAFELSQKDLFVRSIDGKEHRGSWLESGLKPTFPRFLNFNPKSGKTEVIFDQAGSSSPKLGVRRLLRIPFDAHQIEMLKRSRQNQLEDVSKKKRKTIRIAFEAIGVAQRSNDVPRALLARVSAIESFYIKWFLSILERRFSEVQAHYKRPQGLHFSEVKEALELDKAKLWSLVQMEKTGGMPDVIAVQGDEFILADCSPESPEGRRLCYYDRGNSPIDHPGGAVAGAATMGVDLMDPQTYKDVLQAIGKFDSKTSSWLLTPLAAGLSHSAFRGSRRGVKLDDFGKFADDLGWRGVLKVKKKPAVSSNPSLGNAPAKILARVESASELAALNRFRGQYEHIRASGISLDFWPEIEARLMANNAHYLKLAVAMQEGGVLFGIDKEGNPLIADAGDKLLFRGMDYPTARKAVMLKDVERESVPTGYEMFPAPSGKSLRKTPEIAAYSQNVGDLASEVASWLDSGADCDHPIYMRYFMSRSDLAVAPPGHTPYQFKKRPNQYIENLQRLLLESFEHCGGLPPGYLIHNIGDLESLIARRDRRAPDYDTYTANAFDIFLYYCGVRRLLRVRKS